MTTLLLANLLSGVGVVLLLLGHYFVSGERHRNGYRAAAAGGLLVMLGSILLESWSVVFLNLVWIGLSLEGLRLLGRENVSPRLSERLALYLNKLLGLTFAAGMVLMVLGYADLSAWTCTVIYLLGYGLLTSKRLSSAEYMLWTFLGFFLLIDHLIEHQSYSVLFNESLGALISLQALLKYLRAGTKPSEGENAQ